MADRTVRWWQTLTTVEAGRVALADPVVVLPVAAIEQHGPHLPLSTDLDIGLGLLSEAFGRIPEDFPAWALPPQAIGCSREHARFAGTLSVEPEQLSALIEATGEALAQIGVRRLVLSNSHGGNRHALEAAGLRLRDELGMLVVNASWFRFPRPENSDLPEAEWRHGLHGGAVETAMMLHLRPDLVRTSEAGRALSFGEVHVLRPRKTEPARVRDQHSQLVTKPEPGGLPRVPVPSVAVAEHEPPHSVLCEGLARSLDQG